MSMFFLGIAIAASPFAYAGDALQEFALQCDEAIGMTVSDFNCDNGTEVPDTHPTSTPPTWDPATQKCDKPNHLNKECDPGSRFQVLQEDDKTFVVAHCRKRGQAPGNKKYKDIAVIQHNKKNGATCFYQALGDNLDGNAKAPSKGIGAWSWKTPKETAAIGCGSCHDNGPIIRSPYMSQVVDGTGKLLLPGAKEAHTFNSEGDPYHFVGMDFAAWKAFEVSVQGNECVTCHRMGVNNVPQHGALGSDGTARDFGIRATAKDQGLTQNGFNPKNALSADSPMWMVPDDSHSTLDKFSQLHADAAKQLKDCADKFKVGDPLPNTDACRITQFAGRWKLAAVRWEGAKALFFMGDHYSVFDAKTGNTEPSAPTRISTEWPDLWRGGIDAAVLWGTGKAYLFKGPQYVRFDLKSKKIDGGYPRAIATHWPGLWPDGVDAAVPWNNGKIYFFKGNQYIRYDVKARKADSGYPKPIADDWPGVWADGIDAGIQWSEDVAYFFKGNQYIKYRVKENKVEAGFPIPIKGHWPGTKW
jgi:hypothetical protein